MCFCINLARFGSSHYRKTSGVIATAEVLVIGLERIGVWGPDPGQVIVKAGRDRPPAKDSPDPVRVQPRCCRSRGPASARTSSR